MILSSEFKINSEHLSGEVQSMRFHIFPNTSQYLSLWETFQLYSGTTLARSLFTWQGGRGGIKRAQVFAYIKSYFFLKT